MVFPLFISLSTSFYLLLWLFLRRVCLNLFFPREWKRRNFASAKHFHSNTQILTLLPITYHLDLVFFEIEGEIFGIFCLSLMIRKIHSVGICFLLELTSHFMRYVSNHLYGRNKAKGNLISCIYLEGSFSFLFPFCVSFQVEIVFTFSSFLSRERSGIKCHHLIPEPRTENP